jgi:F-type H+-transporting ATPase subunit c
VNKISRLVLLSLGALLVFASPAWAQETGGFSLPNFGVGLTVLGAAYGIGKLASSAYEGMSRQPEVAGNIQTAMIIAAALIEGFTFFALFICMD